MRVLSVDANNDLVLTATKSLAISDALAATMQACEHAVQALVGEMVLAMDEGMPNFETIWNGRANVPQFEAFLRQRIQGVPGVTSVPVINSEVRNNVLSYRADIATIYGPGAINGTV